MKHFPIRKAAGYSATALAFAILAACGDDDSFSPMAKDRGYDYAYTTAKDLSKTPCNEMRDGREAVIGKNKERYECEFDYQDSVYLWVGYDDTLTAEGLEYHRTESSSSEDEDSSSSSNDPSTSSGQALSGDSHESSCSSVAPSSSSRSSSSVGSSSSSSPRSSSSKTTQNTKPILTEKGEQFNPSIEYGTMTDPRDGKKYRTVEVEGVTWMAENLNYAGNEVGESFCYNDDDEFCELYGRLYSRDAAMNSSKCAFGAGCYLGSDLIQGVCPDGWHIPNSSEAQTLVNLANRRAYPLMSVKGWNSYESLGTDTYGLSFVGTGLYDTQDNFSSLGQYTYMWVYYESSIMYYLLIKPNNNEAFIYTFSTYEAFLPARCIKGDGIIPPSSSSLSSSSSSYSSSSSAKSSSSVSSSSVSSSSRTKQAGAEPLLEAASEQFNPDIEYGTMTDPRDGKTYKTVKVGSATWMAENLNYAGNEIGVSTCFNDDDRFCELYGHFYSRSAAMNSSSCAYKSSCDLGTGHIQGICPDGWHIPTNKEAQDLVNLASGHALPLMSAKGWKTGITPGTDTYGLSFVGAGSYCSDYGFHSLGEYGRLWVYYASSTQYYIVIRGLENEAEVWDYNDEECYNPVRCVKDE